MSPADLADARREAGKLSACAWCGAALVQDPDAPHRWRCINAEQGKCVARGYWYILTDDLDYVPALLVATEPAEACPICKRPLTQHRHGGPCSCQFCCNRPLPRSACNCRTGDGPGLHDDGCNGTLPPEAPEPASPKPATLHFICTDFPGPGNECVFVECEDGNGHGINAGEWVRRHDGLVALVVQRSPEPAPGLPDEVAHGEKLPAVVDRFGECLMCGRTYRAGLPAKVAAAARAYTKAVWDHEHCECPNGECIHMVAKRVAAYEVANAAVAAKDGTDV